MTNMIEKVARAYAAAWKKDIKDFIGQDVPSWDEMGVGQQAAMMRCSAAAIEAMREPTKEMNNAAEELIQECAVLDMGATPSPFDAYATMIDAALKE